MNKTNRQEFYLKPKQKVSEEILIKLKNANWKYSKTKKFLDYQREIRNLFKLMPVSQIKTECKFYLAGFLEGEASLNIGAKKNTTSKFKVYLDPEFNITQHLNGISNLYLAMCIFQTGRIRFKSGSLATFVYTIDNRIALEEKIIPFYEQYVNLYCSDAKKKRVSQFKKLLILFKEKAHLDLDRMLYEVLPLWDILRIQKGQRNQTFLNLTEAQIYIREAQKKK